MPSPLHQFPFVGKRSFSMIDVEDVPPTKKAREAGSHLNHYNAENVAPYWQPEHGMVFQGGATMYQGFPQQSDVMMDSSCGMQMDTGRVLSMGDDSMNVENAAMATRYERFPANCSPTHWHTATAVPESGMGLYATEKGGPHSIQEECQIRTW
eukprot:CAMPEP_0181300016 /NCGR_PEP_ID=MMETSP1101-20121128/6660_1 /TAXON_ID=46948 /ORGANISM="Rhodomonas abbreviata, Strain Caron Lab Isolate" /LENGTH=152 /DNA_ID=CAMNT_0023405215 /DNA_START=195 /DNA_END=650 /DNA_ORIENTATION=+